METAKGVRKNQETQFLRSWNWNAFEILLSFPACRRNPVCFCPLQLHRICWYFWLLWGLRHCAFSREFEGQLWYDYRAECSTISPFHSIESTTWWGLLCWRRNSFRISWKLADIQSPLDHGTLTGGILDFQSIIERRLEPKHIRANVRHFEHIKSKAWEIWSWTTRFLGNLSWFVWFLLRLSWEDVWRCYRLCSCYHVWLAGCWWRLWEFFSVRASDAGDRVDCTWVEYLFLKFRAYLFEHSTSPCTRQF